MPFTGYLETIFLHLFIQAALCFSELLITRLPTLHLHMNREFEEIQHCLDCSVITVHHMWVTFRRTENSRRKLSLYTKAQHYVARASCLSSPIDYFRIAAG